MYKRNRLHSFVSFECVSVGVLLIGNGVTVGGIRNNNERRIQQCINIKNYSIFPFLSSKIMWIPRQTTRRAHHKNRANEIKMTFCASFVRCAWTNPTRQLIWNSQMYRIWKHDRISIDDIKSNFVALKSSVICMLALLMRQRTNAFVSADEFNCRPAKNRWQLKVRN